MAGGGGEATLWGLKLERPLALQVFPVWRWWPWLRLFEREPKGNQAFTERKGVGEGGGGEGTPPG